MISIPRFHDLLVGMAPVVALPREPEPVRFAGVTFHQRHAPMEGALWQTTRLYWPDPTVSPIIAPGIGDMPFNPVRPAWPDFPYPEEVPYPARQTWFTMYQSPWYDIPSSHFFGPAFVDQMRRIEQDIIGLYGEVDGGSRAPFMATRGDEQSCVPADTIETLVDLAREGNREDFMFLAGASGVRPEQHEELWAGTRKRLGLP